MTLTKVLQNLDNTISGKEMLLASYQSTLLKNCTEFVRKAQIHYLEINIDELKRIREDVSKITLQAE